MKYSELPIQDQPRRRIRDLGGSSLTTSELLSVALWIADSEAAEALTALHREYGAIASIPRDQIVAIKGLGDRYADALAAIWEIAKRETNSKPDEKPLINSPASAANLVMHEMSYLEQEQLRVLLLDIRNRVISIITLYQGSASSAQVRIGEVFKEAIRRNASGVIICHNHPSGDPTPSPDDVALTRGIVQAGKMLDIDVLDHLVIGRSTWVSLKERGLGFS